LRSCSIISLSSRALISVRFSRFFALEDQASGLPRKALETAKARGHFIRVRKNGSRFWASTVLQAVKNPAGGTRRLRENHARHYRADGSADGAARKRKPLPAPRSGVIDYAIYMLDPSGIVTNWNAGAERMKGYTAKEIVGQHFSRFYTAQDRAAGLPARVLAAAARAGHYEAEGWRVRKDGSHFWAFVVAEAIRGDHGELLGFAKITRDLPSGRRRTRRCVKASANSGS
jgi:PAS domain S-box-containing protein